MKKLQSLLVVILIITGVSYGHAQDINSYNVQTINSEVKAKSRLFCRYVVAVGSNTGKHAVPKAEKDDIVNNRVRCLFLDYGRRYMITTRGRNGQVVKRQKMSSYFTNLMAQSMKASPDIGRTYELRFVGFLSSSSGNVRGNYKYKGTTSDGCKLYASTVVIDQIYHLITWTPEGPVVREEHDMKELEVNVLAMPTGKVEVLLGDILRSRRVK